MLTLLSLLFSIEPIHAITCTKACTDTLDTTSLMLGCLPHTLDEGNQQKLQACCNTLSSLESDECSGNYLAADPSVGPTISDLALNSCGLTIPPECTQGTFSLNPCRGASWAAVKDPDNFPNLLKLRECIPCTGDDCTECTTGRAAGEFGVTDWSDNPECLPCLLLAAVECYDGMEFFCQLTCQSGLDNIGCASCMRNDRCTAALRQCSKYPFAYGEKCFSDTWSHMVATSSDVFEVLASKELSSSWDGLYIECQECIEEFEECVKNSCFEAGSTLMYSTGFETCKITCSVEFTKCSGVAMPGQGAVCGVERAAGLLDLDDLFSNNRMGFCITFCDELELAEDCTGCLRDFMVPGFTEVCEDCVIHTGECIVDKCAQQCACRSSGDCTNTDEFYCNQCIEQNCLSLFRACGGVEFKTGPEISPLENDIACEVVLYPESNRIANTAGGIRSGMIKGEGVEIVVELGPYLKDQVYGGFIPIQGMPCRQPIGEGRTVLLTASPGSAFPVKIIEGENRMGLNPWPSKIGDTYFRWLPTESCASKVDQCTDLAWGPKDPNDLLAGSCFSDELVLGQGCYCDDACSRYQDCCLDYQFTCKVGKGIVVPGAYLLSVEDLFEKFTPFIGDPVYDDYDDYD